MLGDILREVQDFRMALASGTLTVCDGFQLGNAITEAGMEITCGPHPMGTTVETKAALASELTCLIEDLGGAVPVMARTEDSIETLAASGALLKILLPLALKFLTEWLTKQQQN